MTARVDFESLRSLNGGTPTYMAHLKHQVGKLGLAELKAKWTQLIESDETPVDFKPLLRTLRLMSRELDEKKLDELAASYRETESAYRSLVEGHQKLREALELAQAEWSAVCEPGRNAMQALNRKVHDWELDAWKRSLLCRITPCFHNIPELIAEYDESLVKEERARFLGALDWQLATQQSEDGLEEMEILDQTLERLDAIWDKCFLQLAGSDGLGAKFEEAKANFEKVKGGIATELAQKLPESGQFALVRMARLLWQDEHEAHRSSFDWLLTRVDSNGLLRSTWVPGEPRPAIRIKNNR